MRYYLSFILFSMIISSAFAAQTPIKLSTDQRIAVVPYTENNVVPIEGTTFTATQVTFSKDEYIKNIQNGDMGAWTASVDKNLPYMLFLKPTAYDSHTNMTVVTNQHTYYFELSSNKKGEDVDIPTFALKFIYPAQEQEKAESEILKHEAQAQAALSAFSHPESYNWDYSFHGDTALVPLHVFDDGTFTYLQLQPHQAIPAVFSVESADGKESVVNVRVEGGYLVIQRVSPQFTLRSGEAKVASLFNDKAIAKLSGDLSA